MSGTKTLIAGLLIIYLFINPKNCNAQFVKFTSVSNGTNKIVVPENEVWQLVTARVPTGYAFIFGIATNQIGTIPSTYDQLRSLDSAGSGGGGDNTYSALGSFFVGPLEIWPSWSTTSYPPYYLVFKKSASNTSTASVSATSVVIPQSTSGDVDVKLEQSADNVTWTECLPGTYNSSTVKRFFRLRAVEK